MQTICAHYTDEPHRYPYGTTCKLVNIARQENGLHEQDSVDKQADGDRPKTIPNIMAVYCRS